MSQDSDVKSQAITLSVTIPSPARFGRLLSALPGVAWASLLEWQRRAKSRRQLARLDHRLLQDMGLTRAQAAEEVRKPFWKA